MSDRLTELLTWAETERLEWSERNADRYWQMGRVVHAIKIQIEQQPQPCAGCAALREALTLAKQATNGWACFAKTKAEHADIARLHRAIDALAQSQPDGGKP